MRKAEPKHPPLPQYLLPYIARDILRAGDPFQGPQLDSELA